MSERPPMKPLKLSVAYEGVILVICAWNLYVQGSKIPEAFGRGTAQGDQVGWLSVLFVVATLVLVVFLIKSIIAKRRLYKISQELAVLDVGLRKAERLMAEAEKDEKDSDFK